MNSVNFFGLHNEAIGYHFLNEIWWLAQPCFVDQHNPSSSRTSWLPGIIASELPERNCVFVARNMDPSVYRTLPSEDSIRIVTLYPGDADDEVRLSLIPAELGSCIEYEALSYVWGPPDFAQTISCKGKSCKVTANLMLALKRLRYSDKGICIYSHRTIMKDLRILRFAPQFFAGFNFTYLASWIW